LLPIGHLSYFLLQIGHLTHKIFKLSSLFSANFVKKLLIDHLTLKMVGPKVFRTSNMITYTHFFLLVFEFQT